MTECFLGIDGGGTRTDAVLVDRDGRVLSRVIGPTSNKAVIGRVAAIGVLRDLITQVLAEIGASPPLPGARIGLAGADDPDDVTAIRAGLSDLVTDPVVTHDADIVLTAMPEDASIAVIAGTGSIGYARNVDGDRARSGGWGHIFGDEGSAWWLGVEALRAVAAAADGRGPKTSLSEGLMRHWDVTSPHRLIPAVYAQGVSKSDVASSAPVVVEAARGGDAVAARLLRQTGADLGALVASLLGRVPFDAPPTVAVTGGLLLEVPEVGEALTEVLAGLRCRPEPLPVRDIAVSAARAARRLRNHGDAP